MKLSRIAVGQALRTARDAAGLTLADLAKVTSLNVSSISRTERGERDLTFSEMLEVCEAVKIDNAHFRMLAETFEKHDVASTKGQITSLEADLINLQRAALELAIEARNVGLPT